MEITRKNFEETFPRFFAALETANLVALDIECTGIRPKAAIMRTDTPSEYYAKFRDVPANYQIIQLGIALFEKQSDRHRVHTYYFYLIPDSQGERMDSSFQLSTATLEFLNRSGTIDYNVWLRDGLPYCSHDKRGKLSDCMAGEGLAAQLAALSLRGESSAKLPTQINKADEQATVKAALAEFEKWVRSDDPKPFCYKAKKPYLRNYFHENNALFAENRANLSVSESREEGGAVTLVFERRSAATAERSEAALTAALGFSRLWDRFAAEVRKRRIPVVGHNASADLFFIFTALERALPNCYSKARACLSEAFPVFYDTKVLAAAQGLDALSLSELHARLAADNLKFEYAEERALEYHNAGMDARATGEVFLALAARAPAYERFQNCVKVFSLKYFHMHLGKSEDFAFGEAVVLYPPVDAAVESLREKAMRALRAGSCGGRAAGLTEHVCPLGYLPARVFFLEGKPTEATREQLCKSFTIKSLAEHCKSINDFIERD